MKSLVETFNKAGIFHTVADSKVTIVGQQSRLTPDQKDFLREYYGLTDYTVVKSKENPFKATLKEFTSKDGKVVRS
jgi:hypothetical protein